MTLVLLSFFFEHYHIVTCACFHRDEVQAELNTPSPEMDYCSTTQKDFCVEGFVPLTPETTQVSVSMCTLNYEHNNMFSAQTPMSILALQ